MQFGTTKGGEAIEAFSLVTSEAVVCISNFGARIISYEYKGRDLLYGPKTPEELVEDTCYCGAVCGRVANRIAGGKFELDGKEYTLAVNNGANHLHGGLCGFSDRVWTVQEATADTLVLSLVSADGEEGYPGCVSVKAVYRLVGAELTLILEATSDAPTLLNLTNHAYWNLNAGGTIDEGHCLTVHASAYTPMVENIPTGAIMPVAGSRYDLTTPVSLNGEAYDDNFVLGTRPGIKTVAVLSAGGLELSLATDAPGLQVYTGDYLPLKRGGVALEAQGFPDTPHHPHFPSILLEPGKTAVRTIVWQVRG